MLSHFLNKIVQFCHYELCYPKDLLVAKCQARYLPTFCKTTNLMYREMLDTLTQPLHPIQMMLGDAQSIAAGEQKTLGVKWCMKTDHLVLDVSDVGH